ncbi:MAG TPA: YdeI/OmpD-associated family protein, partial [Blastocatellia bacterium]|nr:YdeI/OmpD-associated family protein [Blastocatellia bacterium]
PGYRRTACWWVISAKKEETRLKRLATLIEVSAGGGRVGQIAPAKTKTD